MRFLSNFGCKIIFMCSINFWHQKIPTLCLKVAFSWSCDLLVQVAYYYFSITYVLRLFEVWEFNRCLQDRLSP